MIVSGRELFRGINRALADLVDRPQLASYVFTPSQKPALRKRAGQVSPNETMPLSGFIVSAEIGNAGDIGTRNVSVNTRPTSSVGTIGRFRAFGFPKRTANRPKPVSMILHH